MIENFNKMKVVKLLLSFVLSLITVVWASASHLRAGEITVRRDGCNSLRVFIKIKVYTNTDSDVKFGEDGVLYFGDGTSLVVPRRENTPQPQLGPNIGTAEYEVPHLYGSVDSYLISYVEPNRNGGVLNMNDSFYTTFYLETRFSLAVLGCNNSPKLEIPPIDQACAGVAFFHNPGAYDINGPNSPTDSLSYELVIPYRDKGLPVAGYVSPEKLGGNAQNENEDGPATFTIDPVDGTMIWDAPDPDNAGEYNVAFNVVEWRKFDGVWKRIGHVRRDMQIIVDGDCTNERPLLEVPDDVCVVAGSNINEFITGYDQPSSSGTLNAIKIQGFSEILAQEFPSRAILDPMMTDEDDFVSGLPGVLFDWNTICDHIKGQPYDVVFKITDNGAPRLATFETWKITVVAPAPVLDTAIVPAGQRNVQLTWENYECGSISDEKKLMQIWRKVDDTNYIPGNCDTGMPESLGYTLIATTAITDTQYLDTNNGLGLERGVGYCYRLVAVFGNRGAESYVSNEVCIEPMKIAAPLITKVTVDKTGEANGEITAVWIAPLNPLPAVTYLYELQRAEGDGFIPVSPKMEMTADTLAFADQSNLNTLDRQYFYRVMLYDVNNSSTPVDSSSVASSVRLDLTTSNKVIDLKWKATVPWSNQIQGETYKHIVYSLPQGATTLVDTLRIATIDIITSGLRYSDIELDSTKEYCYAVMTKGSYGNDNPTVRAVEPLENISQINCAVPIVVEPPCAPVISAFGEPCKDFDSGVYSCSSFEFSITVRWTMPQGSCQSEIKGYNLYYSTTTSGPFIRYNTDLITDNFITVEGQAGTALCFKVTAVDRSDRESENSERVCSENCQNYELPNVFTPNGDGCNDTFDAYGFPYNVNETDECKTQPDDVGRCARFVDRVDFKVFNRWGKKVYDYIGQLGNENTIYIQWNGKDNSGKDLSSGIYFYSADVTFSSTEKEGTVKTIKGWVHLVR